MKTIYCVSGNHIQVENDDLLGMNFDHFNLHRALLEDEKMDYASFVGVNMRAAILFKSSISNCNFTGSNLIDINLQGVYARNTLFTDARMDDARLNFGDFTDCSFLNANLEDARFLGSILNGADMRANNLNGCIFYGITYDERTIWPDGFTLGPIYDKDDPDFQSL